MADKAYGIQNLSYNDASREEDYNLVKVQGKSTFTFPKNGPVCTYMFPSTLTSIIGNGIDDDNNS